MDMGGMDMSGLRMIPAGIGIMLPANEPWRTIEFAYVFLMWVAMMVGMMTPSAAPMILTYARVDCSAGATRCSCLVRYRLFPCVGAFALLATLVQWALERTALLDFRMTTTSNVLGGLVFIAAGAYQWTQLKDVCLAQCQEPFAFLIRHGGFRRDVSGCVVSFLSPSPTTSSDCRFAIA